MDADRSGSAVYRFDTGTGVVDDEANALAATDYVENVTDDFIVAISSIGSQTTITFAAQTEDGGIGGGRRNNFELGDYYRVLQGEYTRPLLWVSYPPASGDATVLESYDPTIDATYAIGNTAGTDQKVAQSFILDRDTNVFSVAIRLRASAGTPLGSMVFRIETNNAGVPSGTLADFRAKAAIETPGASAWNLVEFPNPFRLAANTTYWLTAEIPAQSGYYASPNNNNFTWGYDTGNGYSQGTAATYDGAAWTAAAANDMAFKIYAKNKLESLIVHYARSPRVMAGDTEQSEIPDWALEATLLYAEYMAYLKVEGRRGSDTQTAYAMYLQEIEKVKMRVRRQKVSGHGMVRDAMTGGLGIRTRRSATIWEPNPTYKES